MKDMFQDPFYLQTKAEAKASAFFYGCTIWTLISAPGTRFPRAVAKPPRLAPAVSPLDALF
ncbi:hypothetical protein BFRIG_00728 [Peribacillus frigoritolerans]